MPVIFSFTQFMKSPRRQGSQTKQWPPCHPTPTRWPGFQLVTSVPMASMRPAISCPGTRGYWMPGQRPSFTNASLWQMPQASTLILTWARPGSGIFLSTSSRLPPGLATWTAFIVGIGSSTASRESRGFVEGRARTPIAPLLSSSLGVLGTVAGLGEIAIGAVLHGIGVTVPELVFHGVVTALGAFVRLLGTLPAVGIIEKMIAGTFWHGRPFEVRALINWVDQLKITVRLRRKLPVGNVRPVCPFVQPQVAVIVTIGKFNRQLTRSRT